MARLGNTVLLGEILLNKVLEPSSKTILPVYFYKKG